MHRRARGDRYGDPLPGTDLDVDLIEPASGWAGTRGARPTFGEDDYGTLYRHSSDRLEPGSPADTQVLIARSGSSGLRGGRPFFGAEDRMSVRAGAFVYEGPSLGGIVLGVALAAVAFRAISKEL